MHKLPTTLEKKLREQLTATVPAGAKSDGLTELWYAILLRTELWS